jgi:uncharacterized repeat protein (TIGR02543 family)
LLQKTRPYQNIFPGEDMKASFKFTAVLMLLTAFTFSACGGGTSNPPPPTYTVIFNSQSATVEASPTSIMVTSPATTVVTLPTPPTKTGYIFGGWYTETSGGGTEFTASTTVTADITVYAKWNSYTYTVTFDSQSATVEANPTSKTVTSPATTVVTLPTPPTKTGYTFAGWHTAPSGGGTEFTASTTVTANITVYAYWSLNPVYTVTYNRDGGTPVGEQHVTLPETTVVTLPTPPTKTGYIFGGWYTAPSGGGTEFTASTTVTADITVYAKWNSYTYTVTFNSQSATVEASPTSKTVASPDTTVGTLPTEPTKTGYIFGGWWTSPGGGGTQFTASTTVTGNITVYARWDSYTYTVAFDSQSATVEASPTSKAVASPNTTVGTLPTEPTKTGYNFGGWWTSPGGGGTQFTASTTVTGNITVYARWDSYTYTVAFNSQSATIEASPTSKTVTSPATTVVTLPTPPTRTGDTFLGWYTGINGSGTAFTESTTVTSDITVYAKWTAVYAIRDTGPAGGLIFYDKGIYSDGWRYLEAAPSDESIHGLQWYNGTYTTIATGTAIGTGQANTTNIVTSQGAGSYAAQWCNDLTIGGFSDWFLPSKDELNQMYLNLRVAGVGGFDNANYWSSSEIDATRAWAQYFRTDNDPPGVQQAVYKELDPLVRAVRAF